MTAHAEGIVGRKGWFDQGQDFLRCVDRFRRKFGPRGNGPQPRKQYPLSDGVYVTEALMPPKLICGSCSSRLKTALA
jgi:hypothetical protein